MKKMMLSTLATIGFFSAFAFGVYHQNFEWTCAGSSTSATGTMTVEANSAAEASAKIESARRAWVLSACLGHQSPNLQGNP